MTRCSSPLHLRKMLDVVCAELPWLDMVLNIKKSSSMRISPRFNADFSPVLVYRTILPLIEKISFLLFVIISSGKILIVGPTHTRCKKFFRAINALGYMLS